MESWRGRGRQASRDALARLVTAWKAGSDAGGEPNGAEAVPVAVAAIHAVVIGVTLYIMGAPLVIPLAVLVFLAAFVPLVGLLVAGTLAILVTLAAKGWVAAVILLGVLIIEDQLEGHLLQPQVVGRVIRLHPLAIILSLAVGSVLAGIAGAVVAVPIVAVITRAVPELRRRDPAPGGP